MTDPDLSRTLNVLMLAEDFYPKESGGAFIDWNVAEHLVESGDSVTVVTLRNADTAKSETVDGVEIKRPFSGPDFDTHPNSAIGVLRRVLFVVFVIPYLLVLCRRRNFDIVYSTNHLFHPTAALVSGVFGSKHVSFVGYSPSIREDTSLTDPLVVLERANFRWFMGDVAVCQTPSVRDLLVQYSNADVTRLDGIVDKDAIEAVAGSPGKSEIWRNIDGEIKLVFVGRLVEVKNPTKLPKIVAELPPKFSLLIVGDGPERDAVESAVKKEDVCERVHFAGRRSHKEALRAISNSDLLLLPSEAESYGAVVFEALSLNTPVLATSVGVLPTIEHPNLTLASINGFNKVIEDYDFVCGCGIDTESLNRFSVNRFSTAVRDHLVSVLSTNR